MLKKSVRRHISQSFANAVEEGAALEGGQNGFCLFLLTDVVLISAERDSFFPLLTALLFPHGETVGTPNENFILFWNF